MAKSGSLAILIFVASSLASCTQLEIKSRNFARYPYLAQALRIEGAVVLTYAVDAAGKPTAIEAASGHPLLAAAAKENLATWQFVPSPSLPDASRRRITYIFDLGGPPAGRRSAATEFEGTSLVRVHSSRYLGAATTSADAGGAGPQKSTVSPSDSVTLRRTVCLGTCPAYEVTVRGDGSVVWKGEKFVESKGEYRYGIAVTSAQSLIQKFLTPAVWNLREDYSRMVTDHATYTVDIVWGAKRKTIRDYADSSPAWFQLLFDEIDRVAETHDLRHVHQEPEDLGKIGEEFLPKPGKTLLMTAAAFNDTLGIRWQIAEGANVDAADASGWTALMYAAGAYRGFAAIEELIRAGAAASLRDRAGRSALDIMKARGHGEDQEWERARRTLEAAAKQ